MKIRNKTTTLYNIAINDADYVTRKTVTSPDGAKKEVICPYYSKWARMIERCCSAKFKLRKPTYKDVKVCDEWLTFSNFKSWMEQQDWEGKHLDKDLLGDGKFYSPNTCCFLNSSINNFLTETKIKDSNYPTGVSLDTRVKRGYTAIISDPNTGKRVYIGSYNTPEEAHAAWKAHKHSIAVQYAEEVDDPRIKEALRTRYL